MTHTVPAAEVRHISVQRGSREILQDVSLQIGPGEHVMLIGPNGAGKSTLLQVMAGEIPVAAGAVWLNGRAMHEIGTRELAQARSVYAQSLVMRVDFLARDVVAMGRRPLPAESRDDDAMAVARAMQATESTHLANRRCDTLSEGELARVSLARVLAQEAPFVLLDEPAATLDMRHQHLIMHRLGVLAHKGTAVLSIVHDINLACRYADRIAVMHQGRLVDCDVPERIANADLLQKVFDYPVRILQEEGSAVPVIVPDAGGRRVFGE